MLLLAVIHGPDRGRHWALPPGEPQLLGRSTEALPISDRSVSRRHAELTPAGERWLLRDLDSTHGTTLNGRRLDGPAPIAPGDRIQIGGTIIEVRAGDGSAATPAATGAADPVPAAIPDPALGPATTAGEADLIAAGAAVAALSHSIKNILQAMRGGADAVELALSRGDLRMAEQGWPILARNLDRIHALSLNLLAFAHDRALDAEPTLLPPLLREVADLLRSGCERRGVRISIECDEDLPEVSLDLGGIHQALMNLAINAIEAVPDRRGEVTLEARHGADPLPVLLAVRDNGPGISAAIRPRLFRAFVSTKGQRGSGLGLAVTRRIIERHGGAVALDETHAPGTRMTIHLPLAPADECDRTRGVQAIAESGLGYEFE